MSKKPIIGGGAVSETPPAAAGGHAQTHTLPSGRVIRWVMPDIFSIVAFDGLIPSPVIGAVIKLLVNEGAYTPETDALFYKHKAEQIRGMYGIVAAGMVSPVLDISREWGDGDILGRRDIPLGDVEYAYYILFRAGTGREATNPVDALGAASAAPDRRDVQEDAGGAAQD